MSKTHTMLLMIAVPGVIGACMFAASAASRTYLNQLEPGGDRCAPHSMAARDARKTALLELVVLDGQKRLPLKTSLGIKIFGTKQLPKSTGISTSWHAFTGCWSAVKVGMKELNLCAVLRLPGFEASPQELCPIPVVDPRDSLRRLEYVFKIHPKKADPPSAP